MPSTRRFKPADASDDGSGGRWVRGLPADRITDPTPNAPLDYDPRAGAPRDIGGGTFAPNVGPRPKPPASAAPIPSPFKVK